MNYPKKFVAAGPLTKIAGAAGLGGITIAGVGYAVKTVLGLGESPASLAFERSQNAPQSVPEPGSLLLLGAGLLALALWRYRSMVTRLFR
jgi:hypothetical protein